ncbi:MAG: type III PLP-dependent enzyme [Alphaproteobacteria bacterium]|nr:MAG: type III PLP-dependent enzyme [Alphaproteobacteria bacterium]
MTQPAISPPAGHRAHRFGDVVSVVRALTPGYPVYCLRPALIAASARRFLSQFPGTVMYAVKCNPSPMVLDILYRAGIHHFDTASLPEIAQICETYPDAQAYFMHPVKGRAVIKTAHRVYGVRYYVVDHENELAKVLDETGGGPDLTIVVRLKTERADAVLFNLSSKFGAPPDEAADLLRRVAARGCRTGLAFHVGSQCSDPSVYRDALALAGRTAADSGVGIDCLDVGGGFPAYYANMQIPPLEDFMAAIRAGLKEIDLPPTVELFAEPGRALVAHGCSLLVQVQLRKDDRLYINDGIYGSLSELCHADIRVPVRLIRLDGRPAARLRPFVLNGPTCDSLDVVPGTFDLPEDVREGDWIEIDQLGAYSNAMATRFNGFYPETFVEVHDAPPAAAS